MTEMTETAVLVAVMKETTVTVVSVEMTVTVVSVAGMMTATAVSVGVMIGMIVGQDLLLETSAGMNLILVQEIFAEMKMVLASGDEEEEEAVVAVIVIDANHHERLGEIAGIVAEIVVTGMTVADGGEEVIHHPEMTETDEIIERGLKSQRPGGGRTRHLDDGIPHLEEGHQIDQHVMKGQEEVKMMDGLQSDIELCCEAKDHVGLIGGRSFK